MKIYVKAGIGVVALLFASAVGIWVLKTYSKATVQDATGDAVKTEVAVATATSGELPEVLRGIGSLEATRQVMVTTEASGLVTRILFRAGEKVRAGQPLVQLNDEPERGELAKLTAQAIDARAILERTKRLLPQQAATQEQLEQAQSAYDQVNGEISHIKALIDQKQIKSPFDGVLGVRKVNLGQFVHTGDQMVSLTDGKTLYANVTLPEQSAGQVRVGQAMVVTVDAYRGRHFEGFVTTIEPQVDPGTRTLLVQATLPNQDASLAPGMYVSASISLPPLPDVVTVPETAVSYSAYGDFVYVVRGQDAHSLSVKQVYVKTGERFSGRIAIKTGLAAGERVVTSGQLRLRNNAPVRVIANDTVTVGEKNTPDHMLQ